MRANVKESLDRYVSHGIRPGGFLTAVLANDLMQAVGRADEDNQRDLVEICRYVYNHMPYVCHGSYDAVKKWIDAKAV